MISGHRRKLALELNGITEANCYIEELNNDVESDDKFITWQKK